MFVPDNPVSYPYSRINEYLKQAIFGSPQRLRI